MFNREQIEQQEREILAPYALKSADSEGRDRPEEPHEYRTHFQRDRDRIIHCSSFRRLEYKTQVFVNHVGDNYRTRLTHTMEVSQISRSISRALRLNEDFAEALGLAHDLGHTPFGHAGEEELDDLMTGDGGFEHNWQSRRIVQLLENNFHGLNLTREVSESIIKHRTVYDNTECRGKGSFLETQVVNLADEISYNCHDLDDGLSAGILNEKDLADLDIWSRASRAVDSAFENSEPSFRRKRIIVEILNKYVTDLISTSEKVIEAAGIGSAADAMTGSEPLISFSPELSAENEIFQAFLRDNMYHYSSIIRMSVKSRRFIRDIFNEYTAHPESLPEDYQEWAEQPGVGLKRAVADYIAGMTDRYAQDEYLKLFYPYK